MGKWSRAARLRQSERVKAYHAKKKGMPYQGDNHTIKQRIEIIDRHLNALKQQFS